VAVEFHPLTVSVRPETADAVAVTFTVPPELREAFRHVPGQHLVMRTQLAGEDVRRSYSICTSPASDTLRVAVKRIPGGTFSTWATSVLRDGDVVEVMAPIGEFSHLPDPQRTGRYVALAAGSGITPVLSIITAILEVERDSEVTLVYGNRTTTSIMFIEELEALKDRYPDRFQVVHVLSREPHDIPLFEGRIDAAKLRSLAATLIDVTSVDRWFLCGPLDMVTTATDTLVGLGVPPERIASELFFDQRIEAVATSTEPVEGQVTLTLTLDGRRSVVAVDPQGPSLLDHARSVRPEVPFACKGGMCATCKAKVMCGEVRLTKNYALSDDELAAGFILTCQAHPVDADVAITYDVHGGLGR
jgi:ring-1,2-phenylacetyl-CoA epoxidase subunit PaaE